MLKLLDYICAILLRPLSLVFYLLPISFSLWVGRRLSVIAYWVTPFRRAIGYANLRAAFCGEKPPRELKRLIRRVYESLAQMFIEILSFTKLSKKYVDKYIEVVNEKERQWLAKHPDGVVMLTAHFDNWELSAAVCAIKGFPLVVLARQQSMEKLYELVIMMRESKGLTIVRKGMTTKNLVKALHDGKIIGMVGDQNAGRRGVFVDFMGRPASFAAGSAKLAAKTGAYILPAFIMRIKGPYHRVILEEPMKIEKNEDITPYVERYAKMLERHVTQYPEQWLWLHKRWKATPLKKVVILSDGKAGHLNQALAVAEMFKKYRKHSGYDDADTRVDIVEIKFKSIFFKKMLNFLSFFADGNCQGCMRCVKFCLAEDSYENLMKRFSDVVISSGSGVAGLNRFFSIENNAKSACVMKPSILGFRKFNMVILPRHDGKSRLEGRIIATQTVPNLISEEYLESSVGAIRRIAQPEKAVKIGVLLGGDNSDFTLTEDITEELLDNVISASEKLDADILFTTSRRTPKEAETLVKKRLRGEKRCKLLVVANEKNVPHVVGGILGLSDIVVVSGESVSMVSEAIYSEKSVVAFRLQRKKRKRSKFDRMLENLERKNFIVTAEAGKLSDAIEEAFLMSRTASPPEDMYNIYKYMWRLGA